MATITRDRNYKKTFHTAGNGLPADLDENKAERDLAAAEDLLDMVADYLLTGWYLVPFEWRLITGAKVEERYVWGHDYRRLQREVRKAPGAEGGCPACGHEVHPITADDVARLLGEIGESQ